jgi:hypothetical protein
VSPLPQALDGLQIPLKILQRRVRTSDSHVVPQVLIQWSNLPRSLATWEDLEAIKQRFPRAPAWGQAVSPRGGNASDTADEGAVTTEPDAVTIGSAAPRTRQGTRSKRPSVLISGSEWA